MDCSESAAVLGLNNWYIAVPWDEVRAVDAPEEIIGPIEANGRPDGRLEPRSQGERGIRLAVESVIGRVEAAGEGESRLGRASQEGRDNDA